MQSNALSRRYDCVTQLIATTITFTSIVGDKKKYATRVIGNMNGLLLMNERFGVRIHQYRCIMYREASEGARGRAEEKCLCPPTRV